MQAQSVNHLDLVAGLSEEQRKELTEKSDLKGSVQFGSHMLAIAATGAWIISGFSGWQLALVVHGILLVFLFKPLHETIHYTAFRSYWLNVWAARICGFLIFLPPTWFRYFHFAHHRFTNDPQRDPELASPKPETVLQYAIYLSGVSVWASEAKTLIWNAIGWAKDDFVPERGVAKVRREARAHLAAYAILAIASVASGSAFLLYVWIIPLALGQPFLRLCLFAEHMYCPFVSNMLENTRTTKTNRLMRWLGWNMAFHAEHHAFPTVPFHKLPDFHHVAKEHLHVVQNGYRGFHIDVVRNLKEGT